MNRLWTGMLGLLVACGGKADTDSGDADLDRDGYTIDDCDDSNGAINPAATDVVGDGIDQNCDGIDGLDLDGDGWAAESSGGDDCDDADPAVFPAMTYTDLDGDGWGDDTTGAVTCGETGQPTAELGGDCNDTDSDVHPGAEEIWYDDVDNDCDGTTADAPSTAAPVVEQITCSNGGLREVEGAAYPTLAFAIQMTDVDADLHQNRIQVYFDDQVDGTVTPSDSPYSPIISSLPLDDCEGVPETETTLTVFIPGGSPPFDTELEWAFVVSDAADLASEPYILSCRTPREDGSGGG